MKIIGLLFILLCIGIKSCNHKAEVTQGFNLRPPVDTVGFAHFDWQMDSVVDRIDRIFSGEIKDSVIIGAGPWKAAICPHDDYAYASWLYPALLKNMKAGTIIIFGVAHKAKLLNLENKLIFDAFHAWQEPYGPVEIDGLREEIMKNLSPDYYTISDTMHRIEHSAEALVPFLQHYNRKVTIVPILVPYMNYERMEKISTALSLAIFKSTFRKSMRIGSDFALLITTDAVHYGDEDWGGKNYAPYGTDSLGLLKAMAHEKEILQECFRGVLNDEKVRKFYDYTLNPDDYHEYKWTWCGRYCIPVGLLTAHKLAVLMENPPLVGQVVGYTNSIDHKELPVTDLRMGKTAIATRRHWVGYAAVGYY